MSAPTRGAQEHALTIAGRCEAIYAPHEEDPDSPEAARVWRALGAPWFCTEAAGGDWRFQSWDEGAGPRGSSSWWARCSVWPARAAEAAAEWSSEAEVREAIREALAAWALDEPSDSGVDLADPGASYPDNHEWLALRGSG